MAHRSALEFVHHNPRMDGDERDSPIYVLSVFSGFPEIPQVDSLTMIDFVQWAAK